MSSIQIDYSALARALHNEPDFYDRLAEAKETMRREEDAAIRKIVNTYHSFHPTDNDCIYCGVELHTSSSTGRTNLNTVCPKRAPTTPPSANTATPYLQGVMRLLITGGRNYSDETTVKQIIAALMPSMIIHGGASGADGLAEKVGRELEIERLVFEADWDKQGRAAGPLRNAKMIREGNPTLCVAFPGGWGTADCVSKCHQAGVPVLVVPE